MGMGGMGGMGMGGHGMMGQGGMGMGNGGMGMGGMGMGGMGMGCGDTCPGPTMMSLLQQHSKIQRQYKHTDSGIESLTTSDDPQVAALIKAHVKQMRAVLDSCAKGQCTHTPAAFDPLFRAVYANADKLDLQVGVLLLLILTLLLLLFLLLLLKGLAADSEVDTVTGAGAFGTSLHWLTHGPQYQIIHAVAQASSRRPVPSMQCCGNLHGIAHSLT